MRENRRNIKKAYLATALISAAFIFVGCSQGATQISPMPAVDMSKNTITAAASEAPQLESTFQAVSPIELADPVEELKNQGSNTENNGLAAEDDGTIYYLNAGLNSMSLSGYHQKRLSDRNDILYINSYENYVYYVSVNDYGVYRLDKDTLGEPESLNISGVYSMSVIGDHIYYQNAIGEHSDNYVYRTDMDGTDPENLMIKSSAFLSDGETIYFANAEDENKLYSLNTCTGEIEQLSNNQASQINVMDGSIYYINKTTKHITKLDTQTDESTVLSEENFSYLNISEKLLVFYSEETGTLGTMHPDGSEMAPILEYNDVNALNVAGGWIFFESFENTFEDKVFWLKIDGTELSGELPVSSLAKIIDYDPEEKVVLCDFVRYFEGEEALSEYINDNSVSERKAQEALDEAGGVYIQNNNPKVMEYKLSDLTGIDLNINADASYSAEGYKANVSAFEELYSKDPLLILNQLYYITAYEGQLIKISQLYEP